MPEKTIEKLDQEKVYQILSKGEIFTMEDDLKEAMQSQKLKTNLIPEQVKPEQAKKDVETKPIFVEKAHFDPFQLLQKREEVLEKIKKQEAILEGLQNQAEKQEQRWQKEEEIEKSQLLLGKIDNDLTIVQQIRLQAKEREQDLIQKQFVQKQVVKEEQAMNEEQSKRIEEENRQDAIEKLKQIAQQEQERVFTGKLRGPLLKEEILKKLTKVSPEEEAQRKDFLSRINQKSFDKPKTGIPHQKLKSPEDAVVFHPMIKKTSLFEKVAVRVLIIFLIIGIIGGAYFVIARLTKKDVINPPSINNNVTTTVPIATSTTEWPDIFPTTTPTVIMPPISLIAVSGNNILASSSLAILKNKIQYNLFEQVSVFDENQQIFLSAMQFFNDMGVILPREISQETGTSTILVFSSKFGNRLGFILQTENTTNIKTSFFAWENQAETSTTPIFNLMGKTSPALKKTFINLKYKTTLIRCQTFTKTDLGICYAVYKNYFIFTSSFEQMARILDKLP